MNIRRILAVWSAHFIKTACQLTGKQGATLAGKVALSIYPPILKELAREVKKDIFVVCGTNGKTTTNNLLASVLEADNNKVVCNHTGSNMLNGVVSSFVLSAGLSGHLHADYACIEVDEASTVRVFPHFQPDYMVLTNLFRDQLDRYGEIDTTMNLLSKAMKMAPNMKVLVNGDDSLSTYLALNNENPHATYGISEQVLPDEDTKEIREGRFCKNCGEKMEYHFYHYSQLGNYYCPHCGFKRPALDFDGKNISLSDGIAFDVNDFHVKTNYRGFYNVYNILAVYGAASMAGASLENFNKVLGDYTPQFGRNELFEISGTKVMLNLAKNPAGFNQNIAAVMTDDTPKDIIILINDNSQDGIDVSWLWDVDFDRLKDDNTASITVCGIRCLDMHLRLKYVDIPSDLEPDIEKAITAKIENGTKNLYLLVNYTGLLNTHNILKKNGGQEIMKLTIGHLYPDLLNLYGDRGNIQCMMKRSIWRGIEAETIEFRLEDSIDFSKLDIVLLGGGSDREQMIVCSQLRNIQSSFKSYVEDGGSVLAVCGGYQLLGHYYKTEEETIEGLSLVDLHTEQESPRLIDNIVLENKDFPLPIVGFENHGGRTYINDNKPFGKVLYGHGNNGEDGTEGILYKNVVGTYLHGPLLPKNPHICDYLLANALERKYGVKELTPLDDTPEIEANQYIYNRFVKQP